MANQADIERLKQGVQTWNQWRQADPGRAADLSGADLVGSDLGKINLCGANLTWARLGGARLDGADLRSATLIGADLSDVDLRRANLQRANLRRANLIGADLREAILHQANLSGADLIGANLVGATLREATLHETDLSGADLSEADLRHADLIGTNLSEVDLIEADLGGTIFRGTNLSGANLRGARVGYTIFGDVNLRVVQGLETVNHVGPSTLGIDTFCRSQGELPERFLRGAGIPPSFIASCASTLGMPIEYTTCVISYAREDQVFVDHLSADLQRKGVRCWLVQRNQEKGEAIHDGVEEAIPRYDQLLLVLSEHSVQSAWVAKEVKATFEQESQQERRVLFPLRLDDTIIQTKEAWAADLRHLRRMEDFRDWKEHERYQETLSHLFSALTS